MQYFFGHGSFTNEAPFSTSLLVGIRERLDLDILSRINELIVLRNVYGQQEEMHRKNTNRMGHRIAGIHRPHIRPIVRGKENAKVGFGGKVKVSLVDGYTFIDHHLWEAFNEGSYLVPSVEKYKLRFGHYPAEVQADHIYCTRENRRKLKELGIKLVAKPLGRPSATAVKDHVRPGERNPIEGKFGQAKVRYGQDNIKAKLSNTSISWVAAIALVLNLVRLTRLAPLSLIFQLLDKWLGYYFDKKTILYFGTKWPFWGCH